MDFSLTFYSSFNLQRFSGPELHVTLIGKS